MDVISISDSVSGDNASNSNSSGLLPILNRPYRFRPIKAKFSRKASQPITVASDSTERCPVTWSSSGNVNRNMMKTLLTDNSPSPKNKVNSWLKTCDSSPKYVTHLTPNRNDILGPLRNSIRKVPVDLEDSDKRENIFIRHDYKKGVDNRRPFIPNANKYSTLWLHKSLANYDIEKSEECEFNCKYSLAQKKDVGRANDVQNNCKMKDESKSKDVNIKTEGDVPKEKASTNEVVPLSPESQKKIELYSYLQLMNMNTADTKVRNGNQQRRSTRVRNLIMLSERRKLEKELYTEAMEKDRVTPDRETETSNRTTVTNGPTAEERENVVRKSFEELNLTKPFRYDKEHRKVENGSLCRDDSNVLFNVNVLPRRFTESVCHFDDVMAGFIKSEGLTSTNRTSEKLFSPQNDLEYSKLCSESTKLKKEKSKAAKKLIPQKSAKKINSQMRLTISRPRCKNLRSHLNLASTGFDHLVLKDVKLRSLRNSIRKRRELQLKQLKKSKTSRTMKHKSMRPIRTNPTKAHGLRAAKEVNLKNGLLSKAVINKDSKNMLTKFKKEDVLVKIEEENEETLNQTVTMPTARFTRQDIKRGKSEEPGLKCYVNKNKKPESKTSLAKKETQIFCDTNISLKEKNFRIIDLSHRENLCMDSLLGEHNYTLKPDVGKRSNQTIEANGDQTRLAENDTFCNISIITPIVSPDFSVKDVKIPTKEMLEDIIGISQQASTNRKDPYTEENFDRLFSAEINASSCYDCEGMKVKVSCTSYSTEKDSYLRDMDITIDQKDNYSIFDDSFQTPSQHSYKAFNDEIHFTLNDKPPVNIFDDLESVNSPTTSTYADSGTKETQCAVVNSMFEGTPPKLTHAVDSRDGLSPSGSKINNLQLQLDSPQKRTEYVPLNTSVEMKSLHRSLTTPKSKISSRSIDFNSDSSNHTWEAESPSLLKQKDERKSHSIRISDSDGFVINAFYVDFNLVIAQEKLVSFWSQSALGNMLSAQNMWISKGSIQRMVLDSNCVYKESSQMLISMESSIAYVELWMKEHKSDKRQCPVADIFATIYFCRNRQSGPDKKVLQLENINSFTTDVRYVVLRSSRNVIVSWSETSDDKRKTVIRSYSLAPDYQTVVSVKEMEAVEHYVSSLHNMQECDSLVMGCGDHKVTLWNLEYGYVVATVEINDLISLPNTLWVKCDRGFLFMLQHYERERLYKLIAINGINHSWKRLQVFRSPCGFNSLRGVCVDNNILSAFYENGIICWNIQTGESVIEEMCSETVYMPSERHVIMFTHDRIGVQHVLSYFITNYDL